MKQILGVHTELAMQNQNCFTKAAYWKYHSYTFLSSLILFFLFTEK